jgi:hypothetical protein
VTVSRPGVRTDEETLLRLARLSEVLQALGRSALHPSWKRHEALLFEELVGKAKK